MAKKYYAVAKGKTPGIYETWDACKAQVHGYSGAVYKSFPTLEQAKEFMKLAGGKETVRETANASGEDVSDAQHLVAYVDGSYDSANRRYAYGCVLVFEDREVTLNGSGADPDYVDMRNVAGEILGSEQAIRWAAEQGYTAVTIYYDYEGIEKWADGLWKANKPGTRNYQRFVAEYRDQLQIRFCKVAAHTGVKYNEMADQLAKAALGL